jgi:hypothetical protein
MRKKLWFGAVMALALSAANPQRYIVELKDKSDFAPVVAYVESHQGKVVSRLENAMLGLIVDMDENTRNAVAKLPGVKQVRKNRAVMRPKSQE